MQHFNGSDYIPAADDKRLSDQHLRIKQVMMDHQWHTLQEISFVTKDPEASISAQLRHLRKARFGSFVIEKRSRGERKNGLFEYRMMMPGHDSEYVILERKNKMRLALKDIWDQVPAARPIIKFYFPNS